MATPTNGLVVLVAATLVGCSTLLPTASPTVPPSLLLHTTDVVQPLMRRLAAQFTSVTPGLTITLVASNHATLLGQMAAGEIAFFVTTDLPSSAQASFWAVPVAQVGIGVAVPLSQSLRDVSLADLRAIYLSGVASWEVLGGSPQPVTLFSREAGSDLRTEFERLVMGNRRISPNALIAASSEAALAGVRATPGGIAYLPVSEATADVRLLSIEGVAPTLADIRDHRYPLRSTVYVIGLGEPAEPLRDFLAWVQSPVGQQALDGLAAPIVAP